MEKKLDDNHTRMLQSVLNKSWRQHPTKLPLYGHLPPISKTIQVRRTRHAGYCWRSKDELISDVLPWNPSHGRARVGRTYLQQLCTDTGCSMEDLSEAMDHKDEWRERVREIRVSCMTWWYISSSSSRTDDSTEFPGTLFLSLTIYPINPSLQVGLLLSIAPSRSFIIHRSY